MVMEVVSNTDLLFFCASSRYTLSNKVHMDEDVFLQCVTLSPHSLIHFKEAVGVFHIKSVNDNNDKS